VVLSARGKTKALVLVTVKSTSNSVERRGRMSLKGGFGEV
jgi:hypothetical protein